MLINCKLKMVEAYLNSVRRNIENLHTITRGMKVLDLPYTEIDDDFFYKRLKTQCSCIYFLAHKNKEILYVGKAIDLRQRWRFCIESEASEPYAKHHKLDESLELGNVRIHWLEAEKTLLSILESVFIKELQPRWNTVLR